MQPEVAETRYAASGVGESQVLFSPGEQGGTHNVHPGFAPLFARLGLTAAGAFLDLPGEVVSGHPDRHVVRVELPGAARAFYLKRQHVVGWREKLRSRLAGFGWVSRCEREANVLQQLQDRQLPAPRWCAYGSVGSRAFLLVEEEPGAADLRRLLSDTVLSLTQRRALAAVVGNAVAAVHGAGFTTPDLTAKHVLVNPNTLAVTFLDWQSSVPRAVGEAERADALGALHASLAGPLATGGERLRMLSAYESSPHAPREVTTNLTRSVRTTQAVLRAAARHAKRRSVRDQISPARPQRLVWLACEAVCAVPEVAEAWPKPAVSAPFYGASPGESRIRIAGRVATLVRGTSFAPFGVARAWLRATPWRSPGVTAGRVLFHLERYGIPAPQLLAFGQRFAGAARAEWFALYEPAPGAPLRTWARRSSSTDRDAMRGPVIDCLRQLHDAGCTLTNAKSAFAVDGQRVFIADPRAVRVVRRVKDSARRRDLRNVLRLLEPE